MDDLKKQPIIFPIEDNKWESRATFNPAAVYAGGKFHIVYRAIGGNNVSVLGYASSEDGIHIKERLTEPIFAKGRVFTGGTDMPKIPYSSGMGWNGGSEDPRLTLIDNVLYLFYVDFDGWGSLRMAMSKIGLDDFLNKRFNWSEPVYISRPGEIHKNWVLFPEKINGKFAILNSISPKVLIEYVDSMEDLGVADGSGAVRYVNSTERPRLDFRKSSGDVWDSFVRGAGPPPIKTEYGWLLLYHAMSAADPNKYKLGAMILDFNDPSKILYKSSRPILEPDEEYENRGFKPGVVYACGAAVRNGELYIYYGGADMVACVAITNLESLLEEIVNNSEAVPNSNDNQNSDGAGPIGLERYAGNPILSAIPDHSWEAHSVFNPAAIYAGNKIHLAYRAVSSDNTSTVGYASSSDGVNIDERLSDPIYVPRESFEIKSVSNTNSGCEDPRLTLIDKTLYMCYTAYDGSNPSRVALTSIPIDDFLNKRFNWAKPILISPAGVDDKDAALFPKKFNGKYAILHRLDLSIWIDFVDDLNFSNGKWIDGKILMSPRLDSDSRRIGIAGPPIETKDGWLLIYHGIGRGRDSHYHLRAALLDLDDPSKVILRSRNTILEPEAEYEKVGDVNNVVFSNGAVVVDGQLFVYYGGADKVVGVATINLSELLEKLKAEASSSI